MESHIIIIEVDGVQTGMIGPFPTEQGADQYLKCWLEPLIGDEMWEGKCGGNCVFKIGCMQSPMHFIYDLRSDLRCAKDGKETPKVVSSIQQGQD